MASDKHSKSESLCSLADSVHEGTMYSDAPPPYSSLYDESSLSLTDSIPSVSLWPTSVPRVLAIVFGSAVVDYLAQRTIKKRLSKIGSHLEYRFSSGSLDAFSEDETKEYKTAYGEIISFSQSKYSLLTHIREEIFGLRLDILKALIQSDTPIMDDVWYRQSAAKVLNELRELSDDACTTHLSATSLNRVYCRASNHATVHELRRELIEKIAHELLQLERITGPSAGPVMSGIRVVKLLCHDLAYGQGSYAVQAALCQAVGLPWGYEDLKLLNEETTYVFDSLKRMLLEFNNPFTTAMAFRIFGKLATTSPNLDNLLVSYGVEILVISFQRTVNEVKVWNPHYQVYKRTLRHIAIALTAAIEYGFAAKVLNLELYPYLLRYFATTNDRDNTVQGLVEEEGHDDQDIEQDQLAVCQFVSALTSLKDGKEMVLSEPELRSELRKFTCHSNRIYAGDELRCELRKIFRNLTF